ncbi:MAG TPA: FAD-binding and (Fe-S)-binding domain-containing protein [Patescibacteria group bacterium]|nr:FAD-binding and (Fe-S)-binding domain-containing protein [Patescibacteria group bacterium]
MTLESDLQRGIDGEVRFGTGDRAMYASDSSNYRHVPRGVVVPKSVEDIAKTVSICAKHGAAVVHRGGGTSLAGQTIATDAIIIDSSKYCHGILSIAPEKKLATVEPGCVLDDLRGAANKYGLTFGPDPSTHNHNTLGGMIGNNSCGVHSVMAGRTVDNVEALEIMTYDGVRMTVGRTPVDELKDRFNRPGREGEIYRNLWKLQEKYGDEIRSTFPHLPRLVSGYRLEYLLPENGFHVARALVGTESTCVTVLRATVNLVTDPPVKTLLVLGFDDLANASDAVPDIISFGPVACEALDHVMIEHMQNKHFMTDHIKDLPEGRAWFLIQFGGKDAEEAREKANRLYAAFQNRPHVTGNKIIDDQKTRDALWEIRKAGLPVTAWVPGQKRDTWEGWEDSAVPRDKLGDYVRKIRALMKNHDYRAAMYGHFGDGLIHMRLDFGLHTEPEVRNFRAFMEEAADLVSSMGGSLSGEHGDGQSRSELLPRMYTPRIMEAFAEFKGIWDPDNKMNPGDKVQPKKLDQDLRFGPHYQPAPRDTVFKYRESGGDFRRAALRCVGVGECRRKTEGTMCPSYRATLEEKHSTRGRARMFQEMLQADPVRDGWKSEAVRDALNLCLACKACKHECPVNVDMATYKAEFLHHYFKGRLRPATDYAIGMIPVWARLATSLPGLPTIVNAVASLKAVKSLIGIHPDRHVPKFVHRTFRQSFKGPAGKGRRVILWTDTFNNHFTPHVLRATATVLERAGCRVELTKKNICCGRPYYDFGMLDRARGHLMDLMDNLGPELNDDTWVVGIEPSCVGIFRDELISIYPDDPRAKRLSERTLMLAEFLDRHTDFKPSSTAENLIVHGHCHQKSILGMTSDEKLLRAASENVNMLDSGCCGMAGSFGYETEKYPVSKTIFRQVLGPAVEKAGKDDLIVANGFSCRTQIEALTGRRALTLPEVLERSSR